MGPLFYAATQAKRVATTGALYVAPPPLVKLWIDGVLNKNQRKHLSEFRQFSHGEQRNDYALCYFHQLPDGMALREFLDPNVFVLQVDKECTILELNFNPKPVQIMQLRKLHTLMKLNT